MALFGTMAVAIIGDTSKFNKAMSDAGKNTQGFSATVGKAMESAGKSIIKVAAAATAAAAAFAVKYIKDAMKDAEDYALAQTKLETVMRNTMNATDDEIQSIIALAAAQERAGVVSKTAQITAIAELASFVERRDAIEDMLPVMNDYIAYQYGVNASEESARNVATALGKAIQGNIDGLAKQGFQLSQSEREWFKTASEAERVKFVMDMVGESMGGVNEALAQTDAGKVFQLNAALSDTKIRIGTVANGFKTHIIGEMLPSISQLTDAFANLIEGKGSMEEFNTAIQGAISNIVAFIMSSLPKMLEVGASLFLGIVQGIVSALPSLVDGIMPMLPMLLSAIMAMLPGILQAGIDVVLAIATGIASALPELIPAAVDAIVTIVQVLVDNLPMLLDAGLQLIMGLGQGILNAIPRLLEKLPAIISGIVSFLTSAIPQIIDTGVKLLVAIVNDLPKIITMIVAVIPQIITGLVGAFTNAIPILVDAGIKLLVSIVQNLPAIISAIVDAIPMIITSITGALASYWGALIEAGVKLFIALIQNLPTIIVQIVSAIPQIIAAIVRGFSGSIGDIVRVGGDLIKGLWQGISDAGAWLRDKISGFFGGVVSNIKKFFGISSPSKLFAGLGGYMAEGLGVGFGETMEDVGRDMQRAIPAQFDAPDLDKADMKAGVALQVDAAIAGAALAAQRESVAQTGDQQTQGTLTLIVKSILDGHEVGHSAAQYISQQQGYDLNGALRAAGVVMS